MKHSVVHFEIPADDLPALIDFYTKLFGWKITKWADPAADPKEAGEMEYWMIDTDAEPNGGMMPRQHPQQGPMNYVLVESVDDYAKKAEELGAKVLLPKMAVSTMGWMAVLQDPQGNAFGIFQPAEM